MLYLFSVRVFFNTNLLRPQGRVRTRINDRSICCAVRLVAGPPGWFIDVRLGEKCQFAFPVADDNPFGFLLPVSRYGFGHRGRQRRKPVGLLAEEAVQLKKRSSLGCNMSCCAI